MFDKTKLAKVLATYKKDFVSRQWSDEKFKWEAVKRFQDCWDVNALDFPDMLNRSLDKTESLLTARNVFPRGMIVEFAKAAPEDVRAMFIALFDESKDVHLCQKQRYDVWGPSAHGFRHAPICSDRRSNPAK